MDNITYPKRILCLGDSNTWGYIPSTHYRKYPASKRWTGILQEKLGKDYEIIEEGLISRTIRSSDERPGKENRQLNTYLKQCYYSHDPLDYVVIYIGTNELKYKFNNSPNNILEMFKWLVDELNSYKPQGSTKQPQLIFILPSPIDESTDYAKERFEDASKKLIRLKILLKDYFAKKNILFIDCLDESHLGDDGVHLNEKGHRVLADEIYSMKIYLN